MRFFLLLKILLLPIILFSATQPVLANSKISPSLWQIEKNGVTSYLLGTVHLGDQQMAGLPNYVKKAIEKNTDTLLIIKHSLLFEVYFVLVLKDTWRLQF